MVFGDQTDSDRGRRTFSDAPHIGMKELLGIFLRMLSIENEFDSINANGLVIRKKITH